MENYNEMVNVITNARSISWLFITKTSDSPNFQLNKIQISGDILQNIKDIYTPMIDKWMKDKVENKLDPMIDNDEFLYFVNTSDITGMDDILIPLDDLQSIPPTNYKDIINKACAFAFVFHNEGSKVTLLKKLTTNYTLKNKSLFFLDNNMMNELKDDLFVLDNRADCVIYDGKTYILSKFNFEILFNYNSEYTKIAEVSLEKLNANNSISNFENFKDDCLNRSRIIKKLYKIEKDGFVDKFNLCMKNSQIVAKMKNAIQTLQLNFTIEGSQVLYEDITTLSEIINFISNDYLRSFYTDDAFVAFSKSEYNNN